MLSSASTLFGSAVVARAPSARCQPKAVAVTCSAEQPAKLARAATAAFAAGLLTFNSAAFAANLVPLEIIDDKAKNAGVQLTYEVRARGTAPACPARARG